MKSENHEISQCLMISYVEVVVKIWVGFAIFTRTMLTNGNIFIELRNMWLGLEGKWRSNWSSDSKLFRWAIDNIYFFLLIFGNFLDQFDKFYALSIIINMFSLSCVKLEHTTKKYFAVCSPEDTRQTNPLQCVVLRPMFLWRRLGVA